MMKTFWQNRNADAGMIGVIVALLVSIIIGVLVWYKISGAVFVGGWFGGASSGRSGALASANTTNATATIVFQLMPIVAIVVVASVILGIVMTFGRGQA
jgi:hypothetical protein